MVGIVGRVMIHEYEFGFKIREIVTQDGMHIEWPELYGKRQSAEEYLTSKGYFRNMDDTWETLDRKVMDKLILGMDPAAGPDRTAVHVAGAIAYEPHVLTVDKLEELAKQVRRQNMVYVVASDMIPDDAYGILWVRKDDAAKWHELGQRVGGVKHISEEG